MTAQQERFIAGNTSTYIVDMHSEVDLVAAYDNALIAWNEAKENEINSIQTAVAQSNDSEFTGLTVADAMGDFEGATKALNGLRDDILVMANNVYYEAVSNQIVDTGVQTLLESNTNEIVQNAIKDRVTGRLNERLDAMTPEERAEAEGLLKLKEEGRLDEYFASLFAGENSEAVETELGSAGEYQIFYLVNVDSVSVFGAGHGAVIMGSDSEGWYYFSFGLGYNQGPIERWFTSNGNMDVDYFVTLEQARKSEKLTYYDSYLSWDVPHSSAIRSAFAQASDHLRTNYHFFQQNCDDIATNIIRSAGIEIYDVLRPNDTLDNNREFADDYGNWNLIDDTIIR